MSSTPRWRTVVDQVDAAATPVVAQVVRSDAFLSVLAVLVRARLDLARRGEELSRGLIHALNLPTGTDVNRLLTQSASVEQAVRQLTRALEESR